jgi:hypothetical protein
VVFDFLKRFFQKKPANTNTTILPPQSPTEEKTPAPSQEIKEQPEPQKKEPAPLVVRSELNLEQNSIFSLADSRKSRTTTYQDILPNGTQMIRTVSVGKTIDGIEVGILTAHHFRIYLSLLDLWEKQGRPTNKPIHFSVLKIIKKLGLADAGPNYDLLKKHLVNLRQIPITFEQSFYNSDDGFMSLRPFSILKHLDIYERKYKSKTGQKTRGYGEFELANPIVESLMTNYSHPLRLDIIASFRHYKDMATLLYAYLDRNLANQPFYEITLEKLFDHLDLNDENVKYPSQRKKRIDPVIPELVGKPISTGVLTSLKIQKTKDGNDYKLICQKKGQMAVKTFIKQAELSQKASKDKKLIEEPEIQNEGNKELIQQRKESLTPEERKQLREKAIEELSNTPGIKKEFISDILIEVKENEIIKTQFEQKDEESKQ